MFLTEGGADEVYSDPRDQASMDFEQDLACHGIRVESARLTAHFNIWGKECLVGADVLQGHVL